MKLLQYIKALSDVTFLYGTFGLFLAMVFNLTGSLPPVFLLALVHLVGYLLREKHYRYVALVLGLPLIFFIHSFGDDLMPVIALFYLGAVMKGRQYELASVDEIRHFKTRLIAIPFLVFFGYVLGMGTIVSQYAIPVIFLYLVSTNLLLRMLKADQATMAAPAYMRFQVASLIVVSLVSLAISSRWLISTLLSGLNNLYFTYIAPFLLNVVPGVIWVFQWIAALFEYLFSDFSMSTSGTSMMNIMDSDVLFGEGIVESITTPLWVIILGICIVVALFLLILFFIIRRMLTGRRKQVMETYTTTHYSATQAARPAKKRALFLSPKEKVRKYYREFMVHAQNTGVPVSCSIDTTQLESRYGASPHTNLLTHHYRHARYDDTHQVTKEEAAQAKEALKDIKATSTGILM